MCEFSSWHLEYNFKTESKIYLTNTIIVTITSVSQYFSHKSCYLLLQRCWLLLLFALKEAANQQLSKFSLH